MHKQNKLLTSFKNSFRGLIVCWHNQPNMVIIFIIGIITIIYSIILKIELLKFLIIIFTVFYVYTIELINVVVYRLVNRIYPGLDKEYKNIKDITSAIVLLSCIFALIIGLIIFIPETLKLIKK